LRVILRYTSRSGMTLSSDGNTNNTPSGTSLSLPCQNQSDRCREIEQMYSSNLHVIFGDDKYYSETIEQWDLVAFENANRRVILTMERPENDNHLIVIDQSNANKNKKVYVNYEVFCTNNK
jgi:hypothetical protein